MTTPPPPSRRPMPQPTLASEAYWKSGEDGLLRIARCGSCRLRHHEPMGTCPHCHSADVVLEPVSGRGNIVSLTINEQAWSPQLPPPYAVVLVAIAEDATVRILSTLVGDGALEARIGQSVHVQFEQQDDAWIPVFELDADQPNGAESPLPPPYDGSEYLRQPASQARYEDRVALTGVGASHIGRRQLVPPLSLTVQAALAAVADAGLELADIDGLSTYPGSGLGGGMSEGGITAIEQALRIHPVWVNGGSDLPGQTGAISTAMLAVAAGLCRHVLCVRTVWEASESALLRTGRISPPTGRATGPFEFRAPYGATTASTWIALHASTYMHRYGVGREALGAIAVTQRAHAARNPEAVYRDPITMTDYLEARTICTPFGLYDCDVPVDGSIAVVVSAIDAAADTRNPVAVDAVGTQIVETLSWDQGTLGLLPQAQGPARHLWTRSALTAADVDVALLYDGFTFNALSWLETLGFCGPGEATDFLDGGRTIDLDGPLPLNPHGGQLSAGRMHGFGFVREAITQLRGEAGERQVRDCRVAAVSAGGGVPSSAMLLRAWT